MAKVRLGFPWGDGAASGIEKGAVDEQLFADDPFSYRLKEEISRLENADARSLETLGALLGLVLNRLALFEAAEAGALDGAVVSEEIAGLVIGSDEAVALFDVEPFDGACSHFYYFPSCRPPEVTMYSASILPTRFLSY